MKFAQGTKFSITVATVLTAIANLTNIDGLELSADEIDTTTHDSPDGYRTFMQGLKDGGGVSLEGYFSDHASQIALKTLFDAGDTVAMEIEFPDALAKWTFTAFVSSFGTSAPFDDKVGFVASVKVSGKPTLV